MNASLSRERLKARCKTEIEQLEITLQDGCSDTPHHVEEQLEIYRMALAGMDSEPVAQVAERFVFLLRKQDNAERWPVGTKLYAAPPATVDLPDDETLREMVRAWNRAATPQEAYQAMRAAILRGAQ